MLYRYQHYLDEKKKEQELKFENEQKKKKEVEDKKCAMEKLEKQKKDIENCETQLKLKRKKEHDKGKMAKKLFIEANKRLKSAVEAKNFEEVELAYAMLAGVSQVEKEKDLEKKETDELQQKLMKLHKSLVK